MKNIMGCEEAAEFVSALCDGETVPRVAAEHIGSCQVCRERLESYIGMGAELRRAASMETTNEWKHRTWERQQGILQTWWQKGWETMRIPRFGFALLLMVVAGLSSGLAIVGVRARTHGTVVLLNVTSPSGNGTECPLSTEDAQSKECGWLVGGNSGDLIYRIKMLARDGDRVELGVRTKLVASGTPNTPDAIKDAPEGTYWFEPGKVLQVDAAGVGPLTLTGEWLDHMPYFGQLNLDRNLTPGDNEIRLISPVLLSGNRVLFDFHNGSADANGEGHPAIGMYVPESGLYAFFLSPVENGVKGKIQENRLSFEVDGQSCVLLTAAPITRSTQIWVLHVAGFKPTGRLGSGASFWTDHQDHLLLEVRAQS
jgi:hypothetical protein